jgi:MraZ protein
LKIPAAFKKALESSYGTTLFVTALTNEALQVYPMPVWESIEAKAGELGMMDPKRRRFLSRANRFGSEVEMDNQGRIPIKAIQKNILNHAEEVTLIGQMDHFEVHPAIPEVEQGAEEQLTEDDLRALGI